MEIEHVLVFFESPDGKNLWKPVAREDIPDWLREPSIIERLIAGDEVRNTEEKTERYFKAVEVDRPRPAAQRAARRAANRSLLLVKPSALDANGGMTTAFHGSRVRP